jgi:hypothetical protein
MRITLWLLLPLCGLLSLGLWGTSRNAQRHLPPNGSSSKAVPARPTIATTPEVHRERLEKPFVAATPEEITQIESTSPRTGATESVASILEEAARRDTSSEVRADAVLRLGYEKPETAAFLACTAIFQEPDADVRARWAELVARAPGGQAILSYLATSGKPGDPDRLAAERLLAWEEPSSSGDLDDEALSIEGDQP